MQTLTLGKHNPKLVELRKAIDHGALTPEGFLPIEGPKLIEEAVRSGVVLVEVFARQGFAVESLHLPPGTPVYELDPSLFKTIQGTPASQGIMGLVQPREYRFADMLHGPNPLIVLLSRLQDPGNAGTILRVAESFEASGCVATSGTVSIHNPKFVRATAGSIFRLPHVWGLDPVEAFARIRDMGISLIGSSPLGKITIDRWDWRRPSAIVVGNEGSGLTDDEIQMCDTVLRIPHNPAVESLNSAVAASVVLYEAFTQRKRR